MPKKRYNAEEIIHELRGADVLLGHGFPLLSEPGTLSWIIGPICPISADGLLRFRREPTIRTQVEFRPEIRPSLG